MSKLFKKTFCFYIALVIALQVSLPGSLALTIVSASTNEQKTEVPEGYTGIYSIIDLNNVRHNLGGKFILMNDLDLTQATSQGGEFYRDGQGWEPIGNREAYFKGIFDGNGYTIKGMKITALSNADTIYLGLFGVSYRAVFQNITLEETRIQVERNYSAYGTAEVVTDIYIGGLVGSIEETKVINSVFDGSINFSHFFDYAFTAIHQESNVGGLIGYSRESELANNVNNGIIDGKTVSRDENEMNFGADSAGGIVGYSDKTVISGSTNNGNIHVSTKPTEDYGLAQIGGIAGIAYDTEIMGSSNTGNISGESNYKTNAGGIVGTISTNDYEYRSTISGSFNSGNVSLNLDSFEDMGYVGGIVGSSSDASIFSTDNKGEVTGDYAGGIAGSFNGEEELLEDSTNSGKIFGDEYAGGIAGSFSGLELSKSRNRGAIKGITNGGGIAGGIVGSLYAAAISESENTGEVSGETAAGIAGLVREKGSTVSNVSNQGSIIAENFAGGILGEAFHPAVTNIKNTGSVNGETSGGIIGTSTQSIVSFAHNSGKITAKSRYGYAIAGGIIGSDTLRSLITNSSNIGMVDGDVAGGISGSMSGTNVTNTYNIGGISFSKTGGGIAGIGEGNFIILRTYHAGNLTSWTETTIKVGGIIGDSLGSLGRVEESYYLDSAITHSGPDMANNYGTKLTWEEMKQASSFNKFDFLNTWLPGSEKYAFPSLKGLTTDFTEKVLNVSLEIMPKKQIYLQGEPFDAEGAELVYRTSLGEESHIKVTTDMVSKFDNSQSGKQQVMITYQGHTVFIDVKVLGEYLVIFQDSDGHELKSETVVEGLQATAPELPDRIGYSFVGWDEDFSYVLTDLIVKAQYEINKYKVSFVDEEGNSIDVQEVQHSSSAVEPAPPLKEGYRFLHWSKSFDSVTSDLIIVPIYEALSYDIIFQDFDGTEIKHEKIQHKEPITAPKNPIRRGFTFIGWDQQVTNAISDLIIKAQYKINQYEVTYKNDTGKTIDVKKVDYDKTAPIPLEPLKSGYTFVGWFRSPSDITSFDFRTPINADLNLTAKYIKNPDMPGSMKATPVAYDKIKINWVKSNEATGYEVYRATSSNGTYSNVKTITSGSTLSYENGGLAMGKTYYYKIRAYRTVVGKKVYSSFSGTVSAKPVLTTVSAKAVAAGYDKNKVSWSRVSGADGYEVHRADSFNGPYSNAKTINGGSTVSFENTGLTTEKTYYYKIRAFRMVDGKKTYGSFSSAVNAKPSLAAVTSAKAASAGYSKNKVSWSKVNGANGYVVYRATSKSGTYSAVKTIASASTLSYENTVLTTGKTYYYKLRAYRTVSRKNIYGPYSSIISAVPVLAIPAKITVAKASSTSIKASWSKVSEASGYELYRATSKTGTYTKVKTQTSGSAVSYTNAGLGKGKTYYYKVRAYRVVSGKKIYSSYTTVVWSKL